MNIRFTDEMRSRINSCVLCWLATADTNGTPNVSPKEMFLVHGSDRLLIANIASPVSARNIRQNPAVCVSMVDVFVQKGYKFNGTARIIGRNEENFPAVKEPIVQKFGTRFPIQAVIEVTILSVDEIVAPSYRFFPETTTEQGQIRSAMERYQGKTQQ